MNQAPAQASSWPHDIEQVLDPAALEPLVALGVLTRIGHLYLRLVPGLVEGVCAAVREGDLATVTDICHQLKSSSTNVGAIAFSGHCGRLETAALAEDLAACTAMSADFAEAGRAAMEALATYLVAEEPKN